MSEDLIPEVGSPADFEPASPPRQTEVDRMIQQRERFRAVFSSPEGQLVFMDIMKMGRVFTPINGDAGFSAVLEGQRRLALAIATMVHGDDTYLSLIKQMQERQEQQTPETE